MPHFKSSNCLFSPWLPDPPFSPLLSFLCSLTYILHILHAILVFIYMCCIHCVVLSGERLNSSHIFMYINHKPVTFFCPSCRCSICCHLYIFLFIPACTEAGKCKSTFPLCRQVVQVLFYGIARILILFSLSIHFGMGCWDVIFVCLFELKTDFCHLFKLW